MLLQASIIQAFLDKCLWSLWKLCWETSPHWNWKGSPKEVSNSLLTMAPESKNCFVSIGLSYRQVKFLQGEPALKQGKLAMLRFTMSSTTNRCWSRKSSGNCSRKTPTMSDTTEAMPKQAKRNGADQWEVGSAKRMIKRKNHERQMVKFVGICWNDVFFLGGLVLFGNSIGNSLVSPWVTHLPGFRRSYCMVLSLIVRISYRTCGGWLILAMLQLTRPSLGWSMKGMKM